MPVPAHALLMASGGSGGHGVPLVDDPPTVTAQVACWWADDLLGVYTDDEEIDGSWDDRTSSFGLVSVETGAATPATFEYDGIAGRPSVALLSDGTYLYYAASGAVTTSTDGCIVMVVNSGVIDTGGSFYWGTSDEAGTAKFTSGGTLESSFDRLITQSGSTPGPAGVMGGNTSMSANTVYALEWSHDDTVISMRVNGTTQSFSVLSGTGSNGFWFGDIADRDNFTIGAVKRTTAIGLVDDFRVAFCLIADAPLSSGDRTAVYDWINDVYGV
jgi:hypothetical protein